MRGRSSLSVRCAAQAAGWLGALSIVLACCAAPPADETFKGGSGGSAMSGAGTTSGGAASGASGSGSGNPGATGDSSATQQLDAGKHDGSGGTAPIATDAMVGGDGAVGAPHSTGPGDWSAGDYPPDIMSDTWLEISGFAGPGRSRAPI